MRNRLLVAFTLVAVGSALVALPDDDRRLFSLSEGHGPSAVDAVGTVIVLAGWAVPLHALWVRREVVLGSAPASVRMAAAVVTGAALVLLVVSVLRDLGWWWAFAAGILAGVQLAALAAAVRARD